jgi:hypothetical protein
MRLSTLSIGILPLMPFVVSHGQAGLKHHPSRHLANERRAISREDMKRAPPAASAGDDDAEGGGILGIFSGSSTAEVYLAR